MGTKAQTGGILTIISGSIGILGSLSLFAFIPLIRNAMTDPSFQDPNLTAAEMKMAIDFAVGMFILLAIIGTLLSIFVIIAGVLAVRRKSWGLGLAGAIVSVFLFFPTAIPAIIFMALAKPEFSSPAPPIASVSQAPQPITTITPPSPAAADHPPLPPSLPTP
jgi:hypothetical protein